MVRYDHLPAEITAGERAAIAAATPKGWIIPPLYNCLRPEPPRPWRTAHLRYLERRRLIGEQRRRADGLFCFRLNADGMALREGSSATFLLATGEKHFLKDDASERRFMVLS